MSTIHLHWLTEEADRALLTHVVCGDEISPPGSDRNYGWLKPAGVSRGERILLLTYEGPAAALGFCAVAPLVEPEWVRALRADLAPLGAERRWGPFVAQLGRFASIRESAGDIAETELARRDGRWRLRRARHPSPLIERLSLRDRIEGEELLARFLAGRADSVPAVRAAQEQRSRMS